MENNSNQILYCLLGNEIKNSLSPTIHNNLLKSNNLNGLYITINVDSANLKGVINTLCKLNFRGFNVTIPHKTNIIQYLDSLDPLAKEVNAVNTILHDNKKLIGYNTDVEGFMTPLQGKIKNFDNKKAVILGAGGASKPGGNPPSASLQDAIFNEDLAAVKKFIAGGADVNAPKPDDGSTPLHTAAFVCNIEIVKVLIAAKANVNAKNKKGETPLLVVAAPWEAMPGIYGFVGALLQKKFDLERIQKDRVKVAEILRAAGAK